MKRLPLTIFCMVLAFASFAQKTWTVDNAHSNINFEVSWMDFSARTGEFKVFSGTMTVDSINDLTNAVFQLEVDPASIDVIADRLSEQLRGDRFLDAENYPSITYSSSKAEALSDSTYLSKGKLNLHGHELDQEVLVEVTGHTATKRGYVLGLKVSLTLNKTDFGLDWGSPRLGETVKIVGYILYQRKIEEE